MEYLKQLRLLFHHKYLLRKRQPVISALEIFWPILVFVSVCLVRLQFPIHQHPTCYYNARALPSSGGLNFIQSVVCSIDNPCLDSETYEELPTFPKARIHNLVEHLTPLVNEPNVTKFLYNLPEGMSLASNVLDALIQPEINTILEAGIPINELLKEIDLTKIISENDQLTHRSGIERADVPRVLDGFRAAARSAVPHVKLIMKNFTRIMDLEKELNDLNIKGSAFDLLASPTTSDIISKVMCGKPLPSLKNELQLLKAAKGLKKPQVNEKELESIQSHFCREGYKQIMQMEGGPIIWSFLKPVFSGKILYTPDNAITREIVTKMNRTVSMMSHFKTTLDAWTQTVTSLQNFWKASAPEARLQAAQVFIDFIDQHFEGLFGGLEAQRLMDKLDKSNGLLSLLKFISDVTQCFQLERFVAFDSEVDLEEAARKYAKSHELIGGIVFLNVDHATSVPKTIEYKIRADIDHVPTTKMLKERMWEPGPKADFFKDLGYQRGFVQIQELLDRAITMVHINSSELPIDPKVHLQQFPYSCYSEDKFAFYMRALTPVVATMAWIFLIAFMIRDRVVERELHLTEMLHVLGLRPSVSWLVWFTFGITGMAVNSAIGLFLLRSVDMIPNSDVIILFLYFMCFAFSLINYCYMVSEFFSKSTIASLSGIVAYLSSYLPFMVAITLEYDMTFLHKLATCLSMSTSFCFGMMYMSRFESQGSGIQWSNVWHSPMADDPMNFATAGCMMLIDGVIYFIIGWYVSNVFPAGSKSFKKPFYFFLTPSYWGCDCCVRSKSNNKKYSLAYETSSQSSVAKSSIEQLSQSSLPPKVSSFDVDSSVKATGLSIDNLLVVYNRGKHDEHTAVRHLTLDLKEGQVSTILGRNGAGKTSTISVLTGQLAPTSGSVHMYGYDIPSQFTRARKLLGYCPQYNTLFGELTVREHLTFYCRLKALIAEENVEKEVQSILHSTDLASVEDEQAKNLSGGLQRRLCVALAFIGGSKLIILDEPTASVDPVARRFIWDLITHQKASRTVLLTTHHMDEADILSDQVSIIHRGRLLCSGSPMLLRSKHGAGYQLTVSKATASTSFTDSGDSDSGRASNEYATERETESDSVSCHSSEKLFSLVKCLIPNASLLEDYSNEVILMLPYSDCNGCAHDYATFFKCLDSNLKSLGFTGYGITSTTLEDVFLGLCEREEATTATTATTATNQVKLQDKVGNINHKGGYLNAIDSIESTCDIPTLFDIRKQYDQAFNKFDWSSAPTLDSGFTLKMKQFKGLMMKRYLHFKNDMRSLFCNLLLPCFFIALAMGMTLIKPKFAPDPILPLTPRIYGRSLSSFYSLSATEYNVTVNSLVNQLIESSASWESPPTCASPRFNWVVAKCPVITGVQHDEEIFLPSYLRTLRGQEWSAVESTKCTCNEGCYKKGMIDEYAQQISSPPLRSKVNGYIYNLTKVPSVNQFLLDTFTEFNDKRYGGYTFHETRKKLGIKFNSAKVWFDNNGFHAMPSYLAAFDQALMRSNLRASGINDSQAYTIKAYSHPLHLRSSQVGDQTLMQRGGDAGIALIILVGFIFIPTSFIFYIVSERIHEEKQLQRIFGVGPLLYWISSLIWDLLSLTVACLLSACVLAAFQMPIYTARLNLPAVILLVFLFGWAMISSVYLLSRLFNEPSIAFMVVYSVALFIGINTMVVRLLIDVFELVSVSPVFKKIFERTCQILPPYTLMSGLVDTTRNQLFSEVYSLFEQDVYVSPFSMKLLGSHYITLAVEGVVLFILHLTIELISHWRVSRSKCVDNVTVPDEDADVAEERLRVSQESTSRFDIMRVVNVSKVMKTLFGAKNAVDGVSFALSRGECFGLLGVNGAGKTTLFKMLTGQLKPTSGTTEVNQMSICQLLSSSTSQFIGYCPQADALDGVLTPRDHLNIYSELRGIPKMHIKHVVADSLNRFQLTLHSDMRVSSLSRGTRRKLCLAIAMLGSPQVMLLDEPTSGMDPMSRRCLWSNIQDAIRDRRSVLLTTHTMEECDILCSRIAIMVNGRFRCIGSPQYLKNKFGAGYVITLRLSEKLANWREATFFMQQTFPSSILRAHHHNMLEFSVPSQDLPLFSVFSNLNEAKNVLRLQDFFVSQTTLDQVFINFAREQKEDSRALDKSLQKVSVQPANVPSGRHEKANLMNLKSTASFKNATGARVVNAPAMKSKRQLLQQQQQQQQQHQAQLVAKASFCSSGKKSKSKMRSSLGKSICRTRNSLRSKSSRMNRALPCMAPVNCVSVRQIRSVKQLAKTNCHSYQIRSPTFIYPTSSLHSHSLVASTSSLLHNSMNNLPSPGHRPSNRSSHLHQLPPSLPSSLHPVASSSTFAASSLHQSSRPPVNRTSRF